MWEETTQEYEDQEEGGSGCGGGDGVTGNHLELNHYGLHKIRSPESGVIIKLKLGVHSCRDSHYYIDVDFGSKSKISNAVYDFQCVIKFK